MDDRSDDDPISDEQAEEECRLSLCRHGTEPGDCFRLCKCGHTSDEHDYRRPGACGAEDCDCWTWRDA
jgi:hypothetical protein